MMGERPYQIVFDDCKVPVANLVGKEGEGFKLGQKHLGVGRLRHGARGIGVAERCLEMGVSYAKQRVTFGKPLAERQAIQWKLADSFVELHASRLMVYQAAWKADRGEDIRNEAYMVKLFVDEMSFRVVDRRHRPDSGSPSGKMVRRSAQPIDYRRRFRSHAHGHRPPCSKKIWLSMAAIVIRRSFGAGKVRRFPRRYDLSPRP
jgi:hypothetical protein